jgi:hypothetical protein
MTIFGLESKCSTVVYVFSTHAAVSAGNQKLEFRNFIFFTPPPISFKVKTVCFQRVYMVLLKETEIYIVFAKYHGL